jgi:hypothetical protein
MYDIELTPQDGGDGHVSFPEASTMTLVLARCHYEKSNPSLPTEKSA